MVGGKKGVKPREDGSNSATHSYVSQSINENRLYLRWGFETSIGIQQES